MRISDWSSDVCSSDLLLQIDDYYEPFDFDYQHLHEAPDGKHQPTARPRSLISGQRMEKIHWGPNWEEILGSEFAKRSKDSRPEARRVGNELVSPSRSRRSPYPYKKK